MGCRIFALNALRINSFYSYVVHDTVVKLRKKVAHPACYL